MRRGGTRRTSSTLLLFAERCLLPPPPCQLYDPVAVSLHVRGHVENQCCATHTHDTTYHVGLGARSTPSHTAPHVPFTTLSPRKVPAAGQGEGGDRADDQGALRRGVLPRRLALPRTAGPVQGVLRLGGQLGDV